VPPKRPGRIEVPTTHQYVTLVDNRPFLGILRNDRFCVAVGDTMRFVHPPENAGLLACYTAVTFVRTEISIIVVMREDCRGYVPK
jgi:hypothetical protein